MSGEPAGFRRLRRLTPSSLREDCGGAGFRHTAFVGQGSPLPRSSVALSRQPSAGNSFCRKAPKTLPEQQRRIRRRALASLKQLCSGVYANAATAAASSSLTSNTVSSLVITSRSRTLLVRFTSFSSPPAFLTAV